MENLFQGINNCVIYFDNFYITGPNDDSHLNTLKKVLNICHEKGLRLRKDKCEFMKPEIDFLGYRLNKEGLQPQPEKVEAIKNAPKPENVSQLKSFLGLVNYYRKFISNLASKLEPLHRLLQKDTKWQWGRDQQRAFQKAKESLTSSTLLVHFDPNKPLLMICDASPYGVGAILAHRDQNGDERPICFSSRSLNKAERNYAQIDREALAIIFGVKCFHKFILGRNVEIITDHKPLLGLFGENRRIPDQSSARVQRRAIALSAYSYHLKHRPGSQNAADALSRLPLPETVSQVDLPEINNLFEVLQDSPVTAEQISCESIKDPVFRQIRALVNCGWPERSTDMDPALKPYFSVRHELNIDKGCILRGTRVIIPPTLRAKILDSLHETHIGIVRMKALARCYVWWPQIDADIEKCVKTCSSCELQKNIPPKSYLYQWDWPDKPWKRLHMDFCGPFLSKLFLVICDAHSKWIDIKLMNKITSESLIFELRDVFSTLGLPEIIVTDNGPSFVSNHFQKFLAHNGVKHITSTPYHPSTNGLAERAVQSFKNAMNCMSGSLRERIFRFLTKYRSTPHSTTGVSPAKLMFGRRMRTHLYLLHPGVSNKVENEQNIQAQNHDKHSRVREFGIGSRDLVKNYDKSGVK